MSLHRLSSHPILRWWWQMDKVSVVIITLLLLFGCFVVSTTSPAVAKTYSVSPNYFALRQFVFVALAFVGTFSLTLFQPSQLKRICLLLFAAMLAALVGTLALGDQVKGATRWVEISGVRLQPSEFLKPLMAVLLAQILASARPFERLNVIFAGGFLVALVCVPLLLQPDVAMTLLFLLLFGLMVFLAGMPLWLFLLGAGGAGGVGWFAYSTFPHVQSRITRFLNPAESDTYQVDKAADAIANGHLFGRGAGEGAIKYTVPDAHTDFVFAVIVEEFGIVMGLIVLTLFGALIFRGLMLAMQDDDRFVQLAVAGILCLLGIQVLVNVAVAMHLIPTTGMALPFLSYGGSATLSTALGLGIVLNLTRRRL